MKVKLKQQPERPLSKANTKRWKESPPFIVSPRAILVHRVRFASTHFYNGKKSHDSATLWCGNQFSHNDLEFMGQPPKGRLLCTRCEALAVKAGELSASMLAARHVHQGKLKAVRTCCLGEEN